MNKNIICIDIDDSLLPRKFCNKSEEYEYEMHEELETIMFETFKTNLKKIYLLTIICDATVHITSSWGQLFSLNEDNEVYINNDYQKILKKDNSYDFSMKIIDSLNKHLIDCIEYVYNGKNRAKYFSELIAENHNIVIIDDYNYEEFEGYIRINEYISKVNFNKIIELFQKNAL